MIIVIDFDGTCVTHDFPRIGEDIGAVPVLKQLIKEGHKLVLSTMRSDKPTIQADAVRGVHPIPGHYLSDAVQWFTQRDIHLYGIQSTPEQYLWTDSPKAYGDIYIDDRALGIPLKTNPNNPLSPFVDWEEITRLLKSYGILKP